MRARRSPMPSLVALLLVATASAACSSGKPAATDHGGLTVAAVKQAWKEAGFDPSTLTAVAGDKLRLGDARRCEAGALDGVDTTLCEFATEEAARKAQPAGLALVGETTGTSLAHGRVLLVLADRKNADPNGKRINKLAQTFRRAQN